MKKAAKEKIMDYIKLRDELTKAFIQYQFNLDFPFYVGKSQNLTATQIAMTDPEMTYQSDPIFRRKVESLVSGVIHIVSEVENND